MIKLLIGGDFCPYIYEGSEQNKFSAFSGFLKTVNYSIVNLECPIDIKGDKKPIIKIGPNLRSSSSAVSILKGIGINGVTLANNHFKDYGPDCCMDTFDCLEENNIDFVGAGYNIREARKVMFKIIQDTTFAFINCCEEEFSIATENGAGSNPINSIKQFYDIKNAKNKADIVVVIVHGGIEMYNLPTPKMQERYRFFIDCGADLVINHHQHCYSGMEIYNGKHIYYGLGNLYFPSLGRPNKAWNEGYMVIANINNRSIIKTEQIPYTQSFDDGINIGDTFGFNYKFKELCLLCSDSNELQRRYNILCSDYTRSYNIINPYNNRILRGLAKRGWIPSFVSKKSYLELLGKIRCESHYDRIKKYLEKHI